MVHTTPGQGAGWRIVAGFCPLIAGPLRRLLNFMIMSHPLQAVINGNFCNRMKIPGSDYTRVILACFCADWNLLRDDAAYSLSVLQFWGVKGEKSLPVRHDGSGTAFRVAG